MKKILLGTCLVILAYSLFSQETATAKDKGVVHSHQVKAGASLQYDFGGYYRYETYDGLYYWNPQHISFSLYDGPNTQVFVAYEHIWAFQNNMALGIEPKIGIVFRDDKTKGGFLGANWKFYWVNKEFWRMGLYMLTAYEYSSSTRQIYISKDDGMYSQLIDIKLHQGVYSFDLGFVPFQFNLRSIPLLIELNVNIIGLHVFRTASKKYDIGNGNTDRYKNSRVGGYGPKIELKVGWQIK